MFRDNIPLPEKVRETGEGYTLSGRPLDPNSAAARPYLKSMAVAKTDEEKTETGVEKQTKELTISDKEKRERKPTPEKKVKSNTPSPSTSSS